MIEFQNLDLTFTGLGRTPATHLLPGDGRDNAAETFVGQLSRTERAVLGVLCDQIRAEIDYREKGEA